MRSFLRTTSAILLVVWMGVIFFLSSQNAETSSQTSGHFIETVAENFYPEYNQMTDVEKEDFIASLQFAVRKIAHIGVYIVLGFLAFLTFITYVDLRFIIRTLLALGVGVIYAATDEFHQKFVVGRSCELRDFLFDVLGVLLAVTACGIFVKCSAFRESTTYSGVSKKELEDTNFELCEKLDDVEYKNYRLEIKVREQERTIEELKTQLQLKNDFVEPKKPIFSEPFVEIEKEDLETEQEVDEILQPLFEDEDGEVLEENQEVCEPIVEIASTAQTEEILEESIEQIQEELPEETEVLIEETESFEAEEVIEEPVVVKEKREVKVDSETEYAAKIIGKTVVEATKVCNKITSSPNAENQKELVNLALGRCEVLKSEILKIIGCEITFEAKKDLIEKERRDAFDYFDSIKAQML